MDIGVDVQELTENIDSEIMNAKSLTEGYPSSCRSLQISQVGAYDIPLGRFTANCLLLKTFPGREKMVRAH